MIPITPFWISLPFINDVRGMIPMLILLALYTPFLLPLLILRFRKHVLKLLWRTSLSCPKQCNDVCLTSMPFYPTLVGSAKNRSIPRWNRPPNITKPTSVSLCDRIPSTTPGEEPPRDARDSGSARSHSMYLETSSSDRP